VLTLTRSVGERILIGDDIVIEIRAVLDGKQVRISIDAPRQVPIHRAEVLQAVSEANLAAIAADPDAASFERSVRAAKDANRQSTERGPRRSK
jgi:carbon storage regulator